MKKITIITTIPTKKFINFTHYFDENQSFNPNPI